MTWFLPDKRNTKPRRENSGLDRPLRILGLLVAVEQDEFLGEDPTPPPEMIDPGRSSLNAIQRIARRCKVDNLQMNTQAGIIGKPGEERTIARLRLPFAAKKNRALGLD